MKIRPTGRTSEVLGTLGLPISVPAMASQTWDVIVVGAGHHGFACASYLSKIGRKVLVLEARERVGGACTHSGGSVITVNRRNAALEILRSEPGPS